MAAAVFALDSWISRFAYTATEPIALVAWGGLLMVVGTALRGWSVRRSTRKSAVLPVVRPSDRHLTSAVASAKG